METITISATATVTLDGRIVSRTASYTCDVDDVVEQTIEVDTTYVPAISPDSNATPVFYLVVNNGADDALVRFQFESGPANYIFLSVPSGGQLCIPAYGGDTAGATPKLTAMHIRAVSTNTRLFIMAGIVS